MPIQAFLKSTRTLAGPGDEVPYRRGIGTVNMEGELALVIGTRCRDLARETALDVVFGYTIANDVTSAGQVEVDEKFTQVKNGINYTPVGPWIETSLATPDARAIVMHVNGVDTLESSTARLPSDLTDVLVYVTRWMELGPGDLVLTGAPATSVAVQPGDEVAITIDGLGTLVNTVG
nr:fumarylacetoacetate hydrolase family protein [Galbitalea soli]